MTSRWLLLLCWLCWALPLGAETPLPQARVSLLPQAAVWVGQPLEFQMDVLVPNWFTGGLDFPAVQIPGTLVLQPSGRSINFTERIAGQTYAVQRRSYLLVAQRPGYFAIPALTFSVSYAGEGGEQLAPVVLQLPATGFRAVAPPLPADLPVESLLATPSLSLEQEFDRSLEGLQVGDALRRSLRLYGEDTLGAMLPVLPVAEAPSGVDHYSDAPVIRDDSDPREGFRGGERIERFTYVMQQPGRVELPAVSLLWFNRDTYRIERLELPAVEWDVAPAADHWDSNQGWFHRNSIYPVVSVTGLTIAALLIGFYAKRWGQGLQGLLIRWQESEVRCFWRFKRACRDNKALDAYIALQQWQHRFGWPLTGDEAFQAHIDELSYYLLSESPPPEPWRGDRLLKSCKALRG